MSRNIIILIALALNILIFGFYIAQGINDYLRYEAYQNAGFFVNFENFAIFMLMISAAVFAILGVFKIRRARIASFLSGTCFYALLACYLISSFFDPMEQGRNGGAMPFISICIGLFLINTIALALVFKKWPQT